MTEPSREEIRLATLVSTMEHITKVRDLLDMVIAELLRRGAHHDLSKMQDPELETFMTYTHRLKTTTYDSPEYRQCLAEMKPALDHHYAVNRHHPEHFENGIRGMSLIDLLEMFVDWYAATQRHADGDIRKSIEHNRTRFGLSPELFDILHNTVNDLEALLNDRDR